MVLAGHPNHGGKTAPGCFLTAEQMPQRFGSCTIIGSVLRGFPHNSKYDATFFRESGASRWRSQFHREWLCFTVGSGKESFFCHFANYFAQNFAHYLASS